MVSIEGTKPHAGGVSVVRPGQSNIVERVSDPVLQCQAIGNLGNCRHTTNGTNTLMNANLKFKTCQISKLKL